MGELVRCNDESVVVEANDFLLNERSNGCPPVVASPLLLPLIESPGELADHAEEWSVKAEWGWTSIAEFGTDRVGECVGSDRGPTPPPPFGTVSQLPLFSNDGMGGIS